MFYVIRTCFHHLVFVGMHHSYNNLPEYTMSIEGSELQMSFMAFASPRALVTHKCIHPYPATEKCPAECVARDRDHSLEEAQGGNGWIRGSKKQEMYGKNWEGFPSNSLIMHYLGWYIITMQPGWIRTLNGGTKSVCSFSLCLRKDKQGPLTWKLKSKRWAQMSSIWFRSRNLDEFWCRKRITLLETVAKELS